MKLKKVITVGMAAMIMTTSVAAMTAFAEETVQVEAVDSTFVPDDMMDETSISPEEFAELTGITLTTVNEDEAKAFRAKSARSLLRLSPVSLTWATTKPYESSLWDYEIKYNFDDYYVDSTYRAVGTANSYSQEALAASAKQSVLISATPNDNRTEAVRTYVHIVDGDTKVSTSYLAFILTDSEKNTVISNPQNREMYIVMNLANSSYYTRTGNITITAN